MRRVRCRRSGATVVEGAVVLGILLVLMMAIIDLGLAVARYNILAATARQVARAAIVRGSAAAPDLAVWGPTTYADTADDNSEIAQTVCRSLAALPPSEVGVTVRWPDGGNREGDHVEVELLYVHTTPSILGLGGFDLRARSLMRIVR